VTLASLQALEWLGSGVQLAFVFALGAIVGSFINVVVYRLPRNLNIVSPPSACPACETPLTWRQNFPIFGWLWLRGRCRFCKTRISVEYPLVELVTALLFAGVFALWFMRPSVFELVGVNITYWTPEWAQLGHWPWMWPAGLLMLALIGCLVAITIIDAKLFIVQLQIPWGLAAVALLVHPLHTAIVLPRLEERAETLPMGWVIPLTTGPLLGLAIGSGLGLVLSGLLLWKGWMPRSFADYEQWEQDTERLREEAARKAAADKEVAQPEESATSGRSTSLNAALRGLFFAGPGVALMFTGLAFGMRTDQASALQLAGIGLAAGLLIGLVLRKLVPIDSDATATAGDSSEPIWTFYPHARREMLKELLFLTPVVGLGGLGVWLCSAGGPLAAQAAATPAWLGAFGGSVLGLLVGGGIVWAIRIFGSLAFGKEAMGLGDVHLMAGVGAVVGFIDPILAFFTAPFLGIGWVLLSTLFKSVFSREGTVLPFGPQLAIATLLVLVFKPVYESGLSEMLGRPINLP
jgi:leader peptidase (prepilin peptidase) / N-methyltransferase